MKISKRKLLLVVAGMTLPAHGALFTTPIDNESFENPNVGGTFGGITTGWAREAGSGTFIQDENSNTNVPETPYGTQWGGLAGNDRAFYQQIGTFTANERLLVSWLAGDRSNKVFPTTTVEIWAGGTALGEGVDAFTIDSTTLASQGATLVESHTIDSSFVVGGSVSTDEQSAFFNLGSGHTAGDAVWIRIATSGATGNDQAFVDNVQVVIAPDLVSSFTAAPSIVYGTQNVTLNWTTSGAGRVVINDGTSDIVTLTTSVDGQAALDSGNFVVNNVSSDTTYTLTATVAEDGTGVPSSSDASISAFPVNPDLTAVAVPPVSAAPANVTVHFNASIEVASSSEVVSSSITNFTDDGDPNNGFDLADNTQDFSTLLSGASTYVFRPLDGASSGQDIAVLSWSGDTITVAEDLAADLSWNGPYTIFEVTYAGADSIVINDGTSDVFTTSDPAVIAGGSFDAGLISSNTTFTVTAANSASGGSTQRMLPVVVNGTGTTYEESVLADSPLGYYRLEESSGTTTIYDYSGNGNHSSAILGTLTNEVPGALDNAAQFVTETIQLPITLDPSVSNWTLEGIVRPDFLGKTGTIQSWVIWANQNGAGTGRSNLYLDPNGRDVQSFAGDQLSPNPALATVANQTPLVQDGWCHVAVSATNDGGGTYTLRFYLDGVLEGEESGLPIESADGIWVFGSHKTRNPAQFFVGLLDEMAIYESALSATRIQAHNAAFLANASGLLAFGARSETIELGQSTDLVAKVGANATSASIDNGVGAVSIGATSTFSVSPTTTTTYTIDVDGTQESVTVVVTIPPVLVVDDFGTDNGSGFPFLDVSGLVDGTDYQLYRSTDLVSDWTAIGSVITADATGMATFTDPDAFDSATNPAYFYQVREATP